MGVRYAIGWTLHLLLVGFAQSFVIHSDHQNLRRHHSTTSLKEAGALMMTLSDCGVTLQDTLAMIGHPPPSPSSLLQTYGTLLVEKPLATKAITAAVLASAGDAVAQYRSFAPSNSSSETTATKTEGTFDYDPKRGLAFLAFGALYTGCFQHIWFSFMNSHVVDWGEDIGVWGHAAETNIPISYFIKNNEWWTYFDIVSQIEDVMASLQDPPSDAVLAATKVAVNQFAVVPVVYMPLFFGLTGALGGLDWAGTVARAQSLYVPLLQRNYLFWLPVQFIQFLVLPVKWQIPFLCVASFWWTVILSSIGGSMTPSASPSTILVYETTTTTRSNIAGVSPQEEHLSLLSAEQEERDDVIIVVRPIDAGAVNEMTDTVLLQDVGEALVPQNVRDVVETVGGAVEDALSVPSAVGGSASGLALGLLAAAADEATIGTAVGGSLGGEVELGVAVLTAMGAGVGYLLAMAENSDVTPEYSEEAANGE